MASIGVMQFKIKGGDNLWLLQKKLGDMKKLERILENSEITK